MNDAQTVFTLFYGLYFAATIPLTGVFRPFDTPAMYARDGRAWLRFFASFVLLNVFPLFYFVIVFSWLATVNMFKVGFLSMLSVFLLSLSGFGFYRIYFGIMLSRARNVYVFYGSQLPKRLDDELEQRGGCQRKVRAHLIPGFLWVAICMAVGWWWTKHAL